MGADAASLPVQGTVVGVGAHQRSLFVTYSNMTLPGCDQILSLAPSVVESNASVSVTLMAEVSQGLSDCQGVAGTVTVPLSKPLAGRAIEGLQILGGAFDAVPTHLGDRAHMPSVVGLNPRDARLLLTNHGEPSIGGLVAHRSRQHAALPTVIAQRPAAGDVLSTNTVVVLTVTK